MDLRKIKNLIDLLEQSSLSEIEISEGDNIVRLSRGSVTTAAPLAFPQPVVTPAGSPDTTPAVATPSSDAQSDALGQVITSPLVGTFYDSPSPEEKPFVSVGTKVAAGDTLCLIEAMKTFNQLEAEVSGTISAVYKKSGEPVEFGEPLFAIEAE